MPLRGSSELDQELFELHTNICPLSSCSGVFFL
jgi:hypothetical protein